MATYRILSLDGGGIRGVLTAALLDSLLGQVSEFIQKVDLLAGTSTGAILAGGLAKGLAPKDIQQLYVNRRPDIFRESFLSHLENLWGITHAKYQTEGRLEAIASVFGDTKLSELTKKIIVPYL